MKKIKFISAILALAVVFFACSKNILEENNFLPAPSASVNEWPLTAVTGFDVIPGDIYVEIDPKRDNGDRANASADGSVKLTSHSTPQPPGFMFYWSHQNRHAEYRGFVIIHEDVFAKLEEGTPLRVTIKQSELYFDYFFSPNEDAKDGNRYVYYLPYVPTIPNSNSINMVFIYGNWHVCEICDCCKEITCCEPHKCVCEETICESGCGVILACNYCECPDTPDPKRIRRTIERRTNKKDCVEEFFIISAPNSLGGGDVFEVNPEGKWTGEGRYTPHIREHWRNALTGVNAAIFNDIIKHEADGVVPTWVWSTPEPWVQGVEGSQVILYTTEFEIPAGAVLTGDQGNGHVWLRFAADNAAVVYVNGRVPAQTQGHGEYNRGYTHFSIVPGQVPAYSEILAGRGFKTLDCKSFCGRTWQHAYYVDIAPLLKIGENNKIEILAANSANCNCDDCKNDPQRDYNERNNPAGLIFSAYFTIELDPSECIPPCEFCECCGGCLEENCQRECVAPCDCIECTCDEIRKNPCPRDICNGYNKGTACQNTCCENKPEICKCVAGTSIGTVTARNADLTGNAQSIQNANGFWYAAFTPAELEAGVELELRSGSEKNQTHRGTAIARLVNGNIELTVTTKDIHSYNFGMVASNTLWNPSNGNVHSMNIFSHNVSSVPVPTGDGLIYLYVHFNIYRMWAGTPVK